MMGDLKRMEGPPCPNCGCRDTKKMNEQTSRYPGAMYASRPWGGGSAGRYQCEHCGDEWAQDIQQRPEAARKDTATRVVRVRTDCPECESQHTIVTSTRASLRHHKCRDCDATWKTPRSE